MPSVIGVPTRYIDLGLPNEPIDKQKLREYLLDLYGFAGLRSLFSTVQTTDATLTTIQTYPLLDTTSYYLQARVIGKRTGGSAGTAGDSAGYVRRALVFRSGGSATLVGAVQDDGTIESQAAWDCTIAVSGNNVLLRVQGAANNNVTWEALMTVLQL